MVTWQQLLPLGEALDFRHTAGHCTRPPPPLRAGLYAVQAPVNAAAKGQGKEERVSTRKMGILSRMKHQDTRPCVILVS